MFFFGIHDDTQLGTVLILDNETYPSLTVTVLYVCLKKDTRGKEGFLYEKIMIHCL